MRKRISSPALDQYEARRVCLIKPSALGDVVQTLPVLSALRRRYPQAHLSWVVNRTYAPLLGGHPDGVELIPVDRRAKGRSRWRGFVQLARRLRSGKFDLVCDLQGLLRSGVMAALTGAPRRVGLSSAREGSAWFYTDVVDVPTLDMPAVDRYWLLVRALGAGESAKEFRLGLTAADQEWAAAQLARLGRPVLALHPGARWMTKRWPPAQFAALAARAQRECDAGVVLVGGPEEVPAARQIAAALEGPVQSLVGQTDLKQLAALLSQADLVVSGDSGPMHLAAAVGTPVVALFTCTSPVRAAPYGGGHTVVATQVDCAASYLKHCDRLDCMRELSVARVWPAVHAALAGPTVPPHHLPVGRSPRCTST